MAAKQRSVLTEEDLNGTDRVILEELHRGRATPALVAERQDLGRSYVSQRLIRLREHGHVSELVRGLYELVDDPREDADTDADPEVEQLRERVRELNTQLEAARQGDTDIPTGDLEDARTFLNRALDALPEDVPGRTAAEDAKAVLEQALDDV